MVETYKLSNLPSTLVFFVEVTLFFHVILFQAWLIEKPILVNHVYWIIVIINKSPYTWLTKVKQKKILFQLEKKSNFTYKKGFDGKS